MAAGDGQETASGSSRRMRAATAVMTAARISGDVSRSVLNAAPGQDEELRRPLADGRRGSPILGQERDLAQEIAGPEGSECRAVALDPDPAIDDQEELLGQVTHAHQDVPIADIDLVGQLRDQLDRLGRTRGEQRHAAQHLDLGIGHGGPPQG